MVIEPNLHPRPYNEREVCRIVNEVQYKRYVKHGAYPIDIYPSVTVEGKDIIVYIFLKDETKELYERWMKHELT